MGRGPTGRGELPVEEAGEGRDLCPHAQPAQTSLTPRPNVMPGLEMPLLRSHRFPVSDRGMLFSGRGPGINRVALFTLDTLYTAVQSAGEIKASEMVYDAT